MQKMLLDPNICTNCVPKFNILIAGHDSFVADLKIFETTDPCFYI